MLERQVDVALALGCKRIWLFAAGQDELAIRAQQLAETSGAKFRLIQRGRQLLGGMTHQDELLVLAEGLLPADRDMLELLESGPVILRLPSEQGLRAGFERLDRDFCWAGAMILPGRVLERLDELGEDIDPVSALVRAGRVSRVVERDLPVEWVRSGRWSLAAERVPTFTATATPQQRPSPLARFLIDPVGKWLVNRPRLVWTSMAGGGLLTLAGLVSFAYAYPAASLVLVGLAAILFRTWGSARRQGNPRVFSVGNGGQSKDWFAVVPDLVGIAALFLGLRTEFGLQSSAYITILTSATWLLAMLGKGRFAAFFQDRSLVWLGCGLAALAGSWFVGAAVASAAALVGILLNLRNRPAITQA